MADNVSGDGPRIIAIAGGKGGTGKTLLAANVGIFLATLGKRVVAVDAAFGSANLHAFIGVARPQRTLGDFLGSKTTPLEHVIVPTAISNLGLIAGEGDPAWASTPKSAQVSRLLARIRQLDADYIVVDAGSGTGGATLDLFLLADTGLMVVIPEPTSIELAYRFLRAAYIRRLRKIGLGGATDLAADELRAYEGGVPSPSDLIARIADTDELTAERLRVEAQALRPRFVVNNVRTKADMELGEALAHAIDRRMGVPAEYVGHMEYDDAVWVAVRRRRPLLVEHPESRVARCIERVVRRVLSRDSDKAREPKLRDTFYDLLEIEPTATEEEIRRANRRVREIYARDSLVVGGLYNKARLDDLLLRIDEAYETLMDPAARRAYDLALFPGGVPTRGDREGSGPTDAVDASAEPPREQAPPRPPPPTLDPGIELTGQLMRELRETQGLELREISERTKIGIGYLEAIEDENFAKLPAVVYVRGFLVEYARMLRIDVGQVLDTYLERYRRARAEAEAGHA